MKPKRRQGRVGVGHPVDVASGTEFTAAHDIEINGLVPLVWRRMYSTAFLPSANPTQPRPVGPLGPGWYHSFEMTLLEEQNRFVFWGHDGTEVEFDRAPGGRPTSVMNPAEAMELRWENNRYAVYHWHDWSSEVRRFVFRPLAGQVMRLASIETLAGPALHLDYDEFGWLRRVRQSVESRALLLDYTNRGQLWRLWLRASGEAQPQLVASYDYDARGCLSDVFTPGQAVVRYRYDASHRLTEEVGASGVRYSMAYDAAGRCVRTSGDGGFQHRQLHYDDLLRETRVTDSLGNQTLYRWNEYGQVEEVHHPNGAVERTEYDELGRVAALEGPSGERMTRKYTALGELEEIERPGGGKTRFEYNADHQAVKIQRADGSTWERTFENGALVEIKEPDGATTKIERDTGGAPVRFATAAGGEIRVTADPDWTRVTYHDAFGTLTAFEFDARMRIVAAYDAAGLQRRFTYDANGYIARLETGTGYVQDVRCSPTGALQSITDSNGETTYLSYDAYERFVAVTYPDGSLYQYSWDTEGRLVAITNPHGESARYTYDALGMVTSFESFDGRVEHYEYDLSSRCSRRLKADGSTLAFSFDLAGNLLTVVDDQGRTLASNAYDVLNRLVASDTQYASLEIAYDHRDQRVREVQGKEHVALAYKVFGCLSRREFSNGNVGAIEFEYDARRRLTAVRQGKNTLVRYRHDAANLLVERTLGATRESLAWNTRQLVTQSVLDPQGNALIARRLDHDTRGRLLEEIDAFEGKRSYRYSASSRLAEATDRPNDPPYPIAYDRCGNLVSRGSRWLAYARGNRMLADERGTFEHDACGRLVAATTADQTTRFRWNAFDQLEGVEHPDGTLTTYGYDGLGRRTFKDHAGTKTEFYWAGDDPIAEVTSGEWLEYVVGRNVPQILWTSGKLHHVVTSRQHARELVDEAGTVVWRGRTDPWGAPQVPSGPLASFGAPGQYYDSETQLYYNRFRYFSPRTGRFISPDPIGLRGGLNEYLLGPDTINWTDPLGLACGLTHFEVHINPSIQGRGGAPNPTQADWVQKREAFNDGVQDGIDAGTPLTIPTPAQYDADRAVGNAEARQARAAQGMGPGVQADHPVDLCAGGGQGQDLYPLAGGVNGSVGSQLRPQAAALAPGSPTPMMDLYDPQGNLVP